MAGGLVVGVDGGATKTAAVALLNRKVVGQGKGGGSNRNSVGEKAAAEAFREAVTAALKEAGQQVEDVKMVVMGMSGCDRPEDAQFWESVSKSMMPSARAVAENDAVAALCSGTGGELNGIVVISGTGSVSLGVCPGKERVRVGGWGPLLGDKGNGYHIGQLALAAVMKVHDGRYPKTPLVDRLLSDLQLDNPEELLALAYGDGSQQPRFSSWDRVAELAPAVMEIEAAHSCPVCAEILTACADGVCELAVAAAKRLDVGLEGKAAVSVVLAGGVVSEPTSFISRQVEERLRQELPNAKVSRPEVSPSEAAGLLACNLLDSS